MSSYNEYAKPAPPVEAAIAEQVRSNDRIEVQPAAFSEDVYVAPAARVEPATTSDHIPRVKPASDSNGNVLSVAALRKFGTDFESKAAVIQGGPKKNFLRRAVPMLFDERDFVSYGEVLRYVFIQGPCCFVYLDKDDPQPLYAFSMEQMTAVVEDPKRPDKNSFTISPRVNTNEARENLVTVLLRQNGKQAYQLTFDTSQDKGVAKKFMDVFSRNHRLKAVQGSAAGVIVEDKASTKKK